MNKSSICILRSISIVLIAGMAVGFAAAKILHNKKQFKRKTNKTVHAVEGILENVHDMFK